MVTIEQKLALFSKLMQQDIAEDMHKRREELEQDFKSRKLSSEQQAEEEAKKYLNDYKKKEQSKLAEIKSKSKLLSKKEIMKAQEVCIADIFQNLYQKIAEYTLSEEYENSLKDKLLQLRPYFIHNVDIYLTQTDEGRYKQTLLSFLETQGVDLELVNIQGSSRLQLGGLILKVPSEQVQVDFSIDSEISAKNDEITEMVLEAIVE
ncbi:MAG: hypothetical protein ATN33_03545 [Epulopiscium sp. Nele67-Bin001]|nr:MAG: hypothetical protein BEN18_09445 [Epulopiscium sp. Nuni2H_MBin001]OON90235.1 MAG: hypothetical protein ATN33_03545 [Epulopiscium sp. Nele67-Bin001]